MNHSIMIIIIYLDEQLTHSPYLGMTGIPPSQTPSLVLSFYNISDRCNSVLKGKQNFMLNTRSDEDPEVEKELQIRKAITREYG